MYIASGTSPRRPALIAHVQVAFNLFEVQVGLQILDAGVAADPLSRQCAASTDDAQVAGQASQSRRPAAAQVDIPPHRLEAGFAL
ncbi:MAG: hypothetical protein FJZ97_10865 [Chloroflexi bacterium]|nr:hypothetical protein [Chloroflexota bacterium]